MVLRDARDIGKKQEGPGQERWDKLARECGFMYKNKRIRKILRKKKRVKTKKNMNMKDIVVIKSKQKHIKKEKIKRKKDVCSICFDSTENIKYINCKRGGTQSVNFGKYSKCCKDKPICDGCRIKCAICPFCKNHSLHPIKNRFPKKKPTFAVRQERIRLKKASKEKKRRAGLRVSVRRSPNFNYLDGYYIALEYINAPTVYTMDRTPLVMEMSASRLNPGRNWRRGWTGRRNRQIRNRFIGDEPHLRATWWEIRQSQRGDGREEIVSYFD